MQEFDGRLPLWQRIRRLFFQTGAERSEERRLRLRTLTRAIDAYPDVAVNYLLRGELHIELQQWDLAREDLQTALELAQIQWAEDRWGITAQTIMDRAGWLLQTALPES